MQHHAVELELNDTVFYSVESNLHIWHQLTLEKTQLRKIYFHFKKCLASGHIERQIKPFLNTSSENSIFEI